MSIDTIVSENSNTVDKALYFKTLKAGIYTLGCRVNQYESQAVAELLAKYGIVLTDFSEKCDLYVINTCTVTSESDRKSGQIVRRAAKENPNAVIIVTGCSSELDPKRFEKIAGVDFICGTKDKLQAVRAAAELLLRGQKNSSPIIISSDKSCSEAAVLEPMRIHSSGSGRTRAYVKIEDGCEGKCAYCIIPKVRGPIRSKPLDEAVAEISALATAGYKEVVLTGIETSAYEYGLDKLLYECEKINGLERIRLGSLDPTLLKPQFIDSISGLSKPVPHFHLSLQSGYNKTLFAMRRKYNTEMISENIAYMRSKIPDITFTTDIIVGFPGETEEDFLHTVKFLDSLNLLYMHIFTYSIRPDTEAATMDKQISKAEKERRSAELQRTANASRDRVIEGFVKNNRIFPVLFETFSDGYAVGHTPNFLEVTVKADEIFQGQISDIKLTNYINRKIYGECTNAK